ncbi:xanthine dehydrogenase [Elysia marginata]|uniref:Xanthine dehydrogenase n=1 Tax=Elysia marginata TaxID=1093978 RepID=A0AAV4IU87_9GAST|nr:xanthine dehydrogenase [Elysia marginata]
MNTNSENGNNHWTTVSRGKKRDKNSDTPPKVQGNAELRFKQKAGKTEEEQLFLLHQNPNITAQDVEDNFDGNICRCTGYRPILDAMKSFTEDANIPGRKTIDIEDLNKNLCPKTGEKCSSSCSGRSLDLELSDARWYRPCSLAALGQVMEANKTKQTRLVFGNTSSGIYKNEGPFDIYVDLHSVKELFCFQSGSIGGNLMIKNRHNEFPSDIFTTLEAARAEVEIFDTATRKKQTTSLLEFVSVDMSNKVLTAVILPRLEENIVYRSFKITPRWQNSHAYVNAAFTIPINEQVIQGKPSIVLGGISADTIHATKTEDFLTNKNLSEAVIKEAYCILRDELTPTESILESSPKYRKDVASGLLYKVLLGLCDSKNAKLQSGSENLHRPVSSGLQTYQEMASEFPLKHALPKMTSPLQVE